MGISEFATKKRVRLPWYTLKASSGPTNGDGKYDEQSCRQGPFPNKKKLLRLGFNVVLIDEFKTSRICPEF